MKRGKYVFVKKPKPKKVPMKVFCIGSHMDDKDYLVVSMRPHDFIFITLQAAKEVFAKYLEKNGPSSTAYLTAVTDLEDFYPVIISLDADTHEKILNTWKKGDEKVEIAYPIPGIQHVTLMEMKEGFVEEFKVFDVLDQIEKYHC